MAQQSCRELRQLEISVADLQGDPALRKIVSEYFPLFSSVDDRPPEPPIDTRLIAAAAKEISTGVVDATNLLVMDMDLCIRCGNCSLACHKVHGQSRLLRHGIHIARPLKPTGRAVQHVLSPSVCLHCKDPECLTGCPTGAIARFAEGPDRHQPFDLHRLCRLRNSVSLQRYFHGAAQTGGGAAVRYYRDHQELADSDDAGSSSARYRDI
jgi:ferredoxin